MAGLRGDGAIGVLVAGLLLAEGAPTGAVLDDPVKERFFETNVMSDLLALNPFVAENFFPLGQKFLVESRFLKHSVAFLS